MGSANDKINKTKDLIKISEDEGLTVIIYEDLPETEVFLGDLSLYINKTPHLFGGGRYYRIVYLGKKIEDEITARVIGHEEELAPQDPIIYKKALISVYVPRFEEHLNLLTIFWDLKMSDNQ
jgi:hypothetical protein